MTISTPFDPVRERFNTAAVDAPPERKKANRKKRPVPVSLRFTEDEHALIKQAAGSMAVSAYIRQKVLGDDASPRKSRYLQRKREPSMDARTIAKLLATFGHSEVGRSVIALCAAAEAGTLCLPEETQGKLHGACDDIREIRIALITALNVRVQE